MAPMRPAARLLAIEARLLPPILERADAASFDRPTVCTGWSVRDVLAHCGAALTAVAAGDLHGFTPEDNQRDVQERRGWPLDEVLEELWRGYRQGAAAIHAAGGPLDGIGLGEWMHGGDVRDALGEPDAYTSDGLDLALELLTDRARATGRPAIDVRVDGRPLAYGAGPPVGSLQTDAETYVRLCGGRRPDPARFELEGAAAADLVLFG